MGPQRRSTSSADHVVVDVELLQGGEVGPQRVGACCADVVAEVELLQTLEGGEARPQHHGTH